ncbi:MAG: flagellar motor switch protein FliM [bacterium]|nr:flagellar motor switch protein FliM [bacterium]
MGGSNIKEYDFTRPDKLSKEQIRSLQLIYEGFSRSVSAFLSTQLRGIVEVHVISISQSTYEEFTNSCANPTTLVLIDMTPLKGEAAMEIQPSIVFTIVDRLLGGKGEATDLNRELTDIELSMIKWVVNHILDSLKVSWEGTVELKPRLISIESNPQFTQLVPLNDIVILIILEIKIGEIEGKLSFCLPFVIIEPLSLKLSGEKRARSEKEVLDGPSSLKIKQSLNTVKVPIIAELGRADVVFSDLLNMQVGDVIKLKRKVSDDLILKVGRIPKFKCRPGIMGTNIAVQINKVIEEEGGEV